LQASSPNSDHNKGQAAAKLAWEGAVAFFKENLGVSQQFFLDSEGADPEGATLTFVCSNMV
jgi:hypothetical protein